MKWLMHQQIMYSDAVLLPVVQGRGYEKVIDIEI
jgi:hypothetical protein